MIEKEKGKMENIFRANFKHLFDNIVLIDLTSKLNLLGEQTIMEFTF